MLSMTTMRNTDFLFFGTHISYTNLRRAQHFSILLPDVNFFSYFSSKLQVRKCFSSKTTKRRERRK